jgi:hypothetical protein
LENEEGKSICAPARSGIPQALNVVADYGEQHPRIESFTLLAYAALTFTWPCKK